MNRLIKTAMALLLVVALTGTTVHLGLLRGGAVSEAIERVICGQPGRNAVASALVDTIVEGESDLITQLIKKNRAQVEATIADVLAQPEQRSQLGAIAQRLADALLGGEPVVELDPRPLFRPIYTALDQLLPLLNFDEADLQDLEPIVLGTDQPLPDLRFLRTIGWAALAMWLFWLLLALALFRRTRRSGLHTASVQLLSIGLGMSLIVFAAPRLIAGLAGAGQSAVVVRDLTSAVALSGQWLAASVSIIGIVGLVYLRRTSGEGVVASEGATDGEQVDLTRPLIGED